MSWVPPLVRVLPTQADLRDIFDNPAGSMEIRELRKQQKLRRSAHGQRPRDRADACGSLHNKHSAHAAVGTERLNNLQFPDAKPTILTEMKKVLQFLLVMLAMVTCASRSGAQGSAFTYQGQLTAGGTSATGLYDFRLRLFADPLANTLVTTNVFIENLPVNSGLFTVLLDFGAAVFDGNARWLEIGVRPGSSSGPYTVLSPLQPVTATPYATRSASAASAVAVTGPVPDTLLSPNIARLNASPSFTGTVGASGFSGSGARLTGITGLDSVSNGPPRALTVDVQGHVGIGTNNTGAALQISGGGLYSNPAEPHFLYAIMNHANGITNLLTPVSVVVNGTRAYVTCFGGALEILDVSDALHPILLGEAVDDHLQPGSPFAHLDGAGELFVTNNIAYVGSENENTVNIIDVSNPAKPLKLAEIRDGVGGLSGLQVPTGILVSGNRLFVLSFVSSSLSIFDVSNPSNPILLKQIFDDSAAPGSGFTRLQYPYQMALAGTNLLITSRGDHAVTILDISDPTNPKLQSVIADASVNPSSPFTRLRAANWVDVVGNVAYVTAGAFSFGPNGGQSLTIIDISDPKNPIKLAEVADQSVQPGSPFTKLYNAWGVRVSHKTAFVTTAFGDALTVIDVSNPGNPRLIKEFVNGFDGLNSLQFTEGLTVANDLLYVTGSSSSALNIFDLRSNLGLQVNGAVGIGTSSPRSALDVTGNIMATGDLFVEGRVSGNGVGLTNLNAWALDGNSGLAPEFQFLGTRDSHSLDFRVNNSRALRLAPTANSPNVIGGDSHNYVAPGVYGVTIGGGGTPAYPNGTGLSNSVLANFATVGGGAGNTASGNLRSPSSDSATVAGGFQNSALGNNAAIGGGLQNQALGDNSSIAGGAGNLINTNTDWSSVGGGRLNTIGSGLYSSAIAGGEKNAIGRSSAYAFIGGGLVNQVGTNANNTTIGGGTGNTIADQAFSATIAGGEVNTNSAIRATIGGGWFNSIGKDAWESTIAGGSINSISSNATYAAVAGGRGNKVGPGGTWSMIPGGFLNEVNASFGLAAGRRAKANHQGAFVWADSQDADFSSTANNQFAVRAANGVVIQSASPATPALELRTGGLKVTGAGIGTSTPVFVHRVLAANIEPGAPHRTTITHPLCDGDPNAILIITPNYNPSLTGGVIETHPLGVYYNPALNRWQIYHQDFTPIAQDSAYNVLVVKP